MHAISLFDVSMVPFKRIGQLHLHYYNKLGSGAAIKLEHKIIRSVFEISSF